MVPPRNLGAGWGWGEQPCGGLCRGCCSQGSLPGAVLHPARVCMALHIPPGTPAPQPMGAQLPVCSLAERGRKEEVLQQLG